ncbi:MAG: hypothetical protein L3K02_00465 [Thermoplasmata archaeon]|nr:hypothetical protein [Thermoplasmata archaeon]
MQTLGQNVLRRRPSLPQFLLAIAVVAMLALFFPPGAGLSGPTSPASPSSELGPFALTAPTVAAHTDFNVSGTSGTSGSFTSHTGDTIVVFLTAFGSNTMAVSDSTHDLFSKVASASQPSSNGASSLWIFAAYNVSTGATKKITATIAGGSTDSAAVAVVDVTGVGPAPFDHVGSVANYTTANDPRNSSALVPASASDLVLGMVAAHETRVWSAAGGDKLLNDEHSPVPNALITTVDLDRVASAPGSVWINATTARSGTYWMSDGLSLLPKGSSGHPAKFTFTETGLSSGHAWYVVVGGSVNNSTTAQINVSLPNGNYRFSVGPISGVIATPSTGSITIGNSGGTRAITFAAAADDWPTYMGEVSRNGANLNETSLSPTTAPNLTKLWALSTGYMQTEPIVQHGTVYVGGTNGYEYAINASTGVQVWKTFVGQVVQPNCDAKAQGITSSATDYGGMIYVGGGNITGNLTNGTAGGTRSTPRPGTSPG